MKKKTRGEEGGLGFYVGDYFDISINDTNMEVLFLCRK